MKHISRIALSIVLSLAVLGLGVQPAQAAKARSQGRSSVSSKKSAPAKTSAPSKPSSQSRNTGQSKNVNVNQNKNKNVNINQNKTVNVDMDRDVDIDVDHHHHGGYHGGYYGGCCYYDDPDPLATMAAVMITAAVIGSIVNTLPSGCQTVIINGFAYQQCGNTWYQPQISGSSTTYIVVNPPR